MKTLFISLSNVAIERNFAGFQGSVVGRLCEDPQLHVVVLIRKGQFFVPAFKMQGVTVEEIEEDAARNLVQSAFNFFYSFLIFTPTTRLVSSYGVRADKPRPLVKYWNYPVKWLIANTLGKSRWVRLVAVPALYKKLFPRRSYKYLFDKYKPDLVFLPNICIWPNDIQLLVEAKQSGVPTVGMHGNWDHFSKYFIPFRPDKLLVWSEPVKQEALDFQNYKPEDITITGAPHADFFLDASNYLSREAYLKLWDIPQDSTVITLASQGPYSLDGQDLVDMMLKWSEQGLLPRNTYIIIRPHPSGIMEVEKYLRFQDHPRIRMDDVKEAFTLQGFKHYINVLFHSDVVVTTFSTVGPDAVLLDRPVVIAGFDGYKVRPMHQSVRRHKKFTHYTMILKGKGVYHATSPEMFLQQLQFTLRSPDFNKVDREILAQQVFGYLDKKNAERIVQTILGQVEFQN